MTSRALARREASACRPRVLRAEHSACLGPARFQRLLQSTHLLSSLTGDGAAPQPSGGLSGLLKVTTGAWCGGCQGRGWWCASDQACGGSACRSGHRCCGPSVALCSHQGQRQLLAMGDSPTCLSVPPGTSLAPPHPAHCSQLVSHSKSPAAAPLELLSLSAPLVGAPLAHPIQARPRVLRALHLV